jgi:serine/threonine protein kinase
MGPSLSDLFYKCRRQFSVKTVLMLADQLISRLQFVHESGIVHRDVKPGNFVMGTGEQAARVFIIDFGLSNMWKDPQSSMHIKYNQESAFRGTHRYASINSHFKSEQSRRDDLEALGYVLIYFASGGLPWQNVKVARHKRRKSIGKYKQSVPIEDLTRGLPAEFAKYMTYVRSLQFEERPNYDYLKNLFSSCFQRLGFANDRIFDWMQPQPVAPSVGPIVIDPPSAKRLAASRGQVDVIEISSDKDDVQATQIMKAPASPVAYLNTPSYRNRTNLSTSMAVPSTPASGSDLTSSALFSPSMIFGRTSSSPYVTPMARSPVPPMVAEDDVMLQLSSGSDGLRPGNMPPAQVESPLGLSTTSIVSSNIFNNGGALPQSMSPVHQSSHSPVSPPLPTDTIMPQDEIDIDVQEEENAPAPHDDAVQVIDDDDDEDDLVPLRNRKRKRDSVPPQANSDAKVDDEDLSAPKRRSVRLANKQRSNPQIVEAN